MLAANRSNSESCAITDCAFGAEAEGDLELRYLLSDRCTELLLARGWPLFKMLQNPLRNLFDIKL